MSKFNDLSPFFCWNWNEYVNFNSMGKSVCVNLRNIWVNFIFSTQILQGSALFSGNFTQQENFLHDCRSWRSQQISSLLEAFGFKIFVFVFVFWVFADPSVRKLLVQWNGQAKKNNLSEACPLCLSHEKIYDY